MGKRYSNTKRNSLCYLSAPVVYKLKKFNKTYQTQLHANKTRLCSVCAMVFCIDLTAVYVLYGLRCVNLGYILSTKHNTVGECWCFCCRNSKIDRLLKKLAVIWHSDLRGRKIFEEVCLLCKVCKN